MRRGGTLVLGVALGLGLVGPAAGEKSAVPRLNVYFAADFKDTAYQRAALTKVLRSWRPAAPLPPVGKKTVVISTLGRDGTLLGAMFNLRSGSEGFDRAAMEAVKRSAPFPPFPRSYRQPTTEVHWHFEVGR